jgi:bis(5'-nucleosidyl)-tetraphosphatase
MTRREISAGGVVYRKHEGTDEVALIQPRERQAWSLPKGVIEPGETAEAAAEREVREETGLSGILLEKIDTIQYSYMARWEEPPVRVQKVVTFFLLKFTGGDPSRHDTEVDRVEWMPVETAMKKATYPQERAILKKAQTLMRREP